MDYKEYEQQLSRAFELNGLVGLLDSDKSLKLYEFSQILVESNKKFNLTAITDEKEIILKHFVDCVSIAKYIPRSSSVVDVGCGAGFPSIPLSIVREDLKIAALDSTQKRVNFVESVARELNLLNISTVCARAEEHSNTNREKYDVCVSRAVARLNVLAELCIPLVKVGGLFLAMKSVKGDEEYAEAESGIVALGCNLRHTEIDAFSYEGVNSERKLFVLAKTRKTPAEYPRKYSQIVKKPL
ncbi:MAG: 16S rRNA (guanine(527)-N(7))-methyltransferase RsmG [Ruminococcaceae bacterium]|nr:16S rRNA (guanine(527)-N(7))-methyltransferase RsmG [Oscillospiraceae bacterium]